MPSIGAYSKKRNGALVTLVGGLTFLPGGCEVLMSLDGRAALVKDAAEILSEPELCEKKLEYVVRHSIKVQKVSPRNA